MTDRWQQIDEVFKACLELEPVERAALLERIGTDDPELRETIAALLACDAKPLSFIETPALETAAPMFADEADRLKQGQRIAHYEVVRLLGRGGMGEVYLAKDETLKRQVALKLLPTAYTRDKDRLRRFQQEAQAASALNHPNILTIHQFANVDGQQFIATEFVEGETLRDRLHRSNIDPSDALDMAIQIANALAAAHRLGIVHRDIKPENIMLRPDGYVKVLDFGLAKLTEQQYESIAESVTIQNPSLSSSLIMGTVKYMSPEQARGRMVDARSDIFSLGAVLYEILTGSAPFEGNSNEEIISSILSTEPQPLADCAPGISEQIQAVVWKCLCKDTNDRYQRIEDLLADLKMTKTQFRAAITEPQESVLAKTGQVDERHRTGTPTKRKTSPASIVQSLISSIRTRKSSTTLFLLLVFAGLSLAAYASYHFLRRAAFASSHPAPRLMQTGSWSTKAPIDSPRSEVEPVILNGTLYVAGGWNVCTAFRTLESYDPVNDKWTERAPMHTPRGTHGAAALNGQLYVVGGQTDCGVHTTSVEAYDPATNTWSAKAPLPAPRSSHVVAVVGGKLYVIGGGTNQHPLIAATEEYDPVTNRWAERASIPTPRNGASAVVVNGLIYVLGGAGRNGPVATVEAYDPANNTWATKAPMPIKRAHFGASVIDGLIYVFGGLGNKGLVDAYDPATNTWSAATPMPAPRSNFHAATLGRSIYVTGGYDGVNYLADVLAFTPDQTTANALPCPSTGVWSTKASMPTKRSGMATGVVSGVLYVIGGGGAKFYSSNEAYDPNNNAWTTKTPMPTARSMLGTNTAVVNGVIYVIGGNTPGHCTDVNEAYDTRTEKWTVKAPMPTPRCHLSVFALDNLIYAIGGNSNNSFSSLVEVYNPATNTWTTAASMPTPRQTLAVGSVNGILYAVGGQDLTGPLDVVEAYNPATNSWSTKAHMPTARAGLAAGVLNDSLVVVGGLAEDENGIATVEIYNPATDSWTTGASMPTPRGYLSVATVQDTIYALGNGAGPVSPLATNEAFRMQPCGAQ